MFLVCTQQTMFSFTLGLGPLPLSALLSLEAAGSVLIKLEGCLEFWMKLAVSISKETSF